MTTKVYTAMNAQINKELWSAYLYLSMSLYADTICRTGIGKWLYLQAVEEKEHARRLQEFMIDRDAQITLQPIGSVPTAWNSIREMFEQVLAHEQEVTRSIHHLVTLAREEKDYAAEESLWWFVREQVEEEATAKGILMDIQLAEDDPAALMALDTKLGERKAS